MPAVQEYAIKVRAPDSKCWNFLASGGTVNALRVHAIRFQDPARCARALAELRENHPDCEFKEVKL